MCKWITNLSLSLFSTLAATLVRSYSFNRLYTLIITIFLRKLINHVPYFRADFCQNCTCCGTYPSRQFRFSSKFAKSAQHFASFGAFFVQSCNRFLFLFSLLSIFSAFSLLILFALLVQFLIKQIFYSDLLYIKWL